MRKLIGAGAFTKAYRTSENEVEIVTKCPAKECYAMFSMGNPFAPSVEKNYSKNDAYKMPLYPKVRAPKKQLNTRAYEIYSLLRKLDGTLGYFTFVKKVNEVTGFTDEEKENIISLAGDVCNAIDVRNVAFEISPRNITCDAEGNLIMLDCFLCVKTLREISRK